MNEHYREPPAWARSRLWDWLAVLILLVTFVTAYYAYLGNANARAARSAADALAQAQRNAASIAELDRESACSLQLLTEAFQSLDLNVEFRSFPAIEGDACAGLTIPQED